MEPAPAIGRHARRVAKESSETIREQVRWKIAGPLGLLLLFAAGCASISHGHADAAELAQDKLQRDATLESWRTEPRRPVWINPDQDEEKIFAVTSAYPPRMFRVNGLEYPINVGEIQEVPASVASLVEYTQRKRPMQNGPQGLPLIPDPAKGQFLAGSQNIEVGRAGKAGEGRIVPEGQAPIMPLGERYDAYGQ